MQHAERRLTRVLCGVRACCLQLVVCGFAVDFRFVMSRPVVQQSTISQTEWSLCLITWQAKVPKKAM